VIDYNEFIMNHHGNLSIAISTDIDLEKFYQSAHIQQNTYLVFVGVINDNRILHVPSMRDSTNGKAHV
jgi:hypothetical protein